MDQQRRFDHDVAAIGSGGFDSGHISTGQRFSWTFQTAGHYPYRCTIHPFMAGTVDVYAFSLRGPDGPIAAGSPVTLRGIAPAGTLAVGIEARRPDGTWAPVTVAVPAPDGAFRARVTPTAPTVYRAVAAAGPSLPLPLRVGARVDTTAKRLKGGRYAVSAVARPAQAGALAALQLYSRERFRWRQVARARVDRNSRVSFVVSPPGHYAARVVLLQRQGRLRRERRQDRPPRRPPGCHARAAARAPPPHVATCGR